MLPVVICLLCLGVLLLCLCACCCVVHRYLCHNLVHYLQTSASPLCLLTVQPARVLKSLCMHSPHQQPPIKQHSNTRILQCIVACSGISPSLSSVEYLSSTCALSVLHIVQPVVSCLGSRMFTMMVAAKCSLNADQMELKLHTAVVLPGFVLKQMQNTQSKASVDYVQAV